MIVIVGSLKLVSLPTMGNLRTSPAITELPVCSRETCLSCAQCGDGSCSTACWLPITQRPVACTCDSYVGSHNALFSAFTLPAVAPKSQLVELPASQAPPSSCFRIGTHCLQSASVLACPLLETLTMVLHSFGCQFIFRELMDLDQCVIGSDEKPRNQANV